MGLHLTLFKIKGIEKVDYGDTVFQNLFIKEEVKWFDFLRHIGDRDFYDMIEWVYRREGDDQNEDTIYVRPKNIDKAIDLVYDKIEERYQERFLNLLKEMKKDETLWLQVSA